MLLAIAIVSAFCFGILFGIISTFMLHDLDKCERLHVALRQHQKGLKRLSRRNDKLRRVKWVKAA